MRKVLIHMQFEAREKILRYRERERERTPIVIKMGSNYTRTTPQIKLCWDHGSLSTWLSGRRSFHLFRPNLNWRIFLHVLNIDNMLKFLVAKSSLLWVSCQLPKLLPTLSFDIEVFFLTAPPLLTMYLKNHVSDITEKNTFSINCS